MNLHSKAWPIGHHNPSMDWKEAIRQWRALPEAEKQRRRWDSIPGSVARSFAFEGEPVDQAMLEAVHLRPPVPPAPSLNMTRDVEPVTSPICLGYGSHFGLGRFEVLDAEAVAERSTG